MSKFLADYYGAPFIGGKREATGFDAGEDRTPAGKRDVEEAAREYAVSRPCRTRKATPEELAELDRVLGKKESAK